MAMETSALMLLQIFHLHLHLFVIITITSCFSKIYTAEAAENCEPSNCGPDLQNLTYPFGVDPSPCGLSESFLISNCSDSKTNYPLWKSFDCGDEELGCGKLGPPKVMGIYDQPSGLLPIQGRPDQLGASNRDFGFINLTWTGQRQNRSQTPFCNPIGIKDVFDVHLPTSINLTAFANSTLRFSPYSVFLLLNCSKWSARRISMPVVAHTNSSLCQSYQSICTNGTSSSSNGSFASCIQITPSKELMLQDIAETFECTGCIFFVNITKTALNFPVNGSASGEQAARPPSFFSTSIQLTWSHSEFRSEGNCQDCELSGGWCGYGSPSSSFKCFCAGNITSDHNCSASPSVPMSSTNTKKSNALVIATVTTYMGAALAIVAFISWFCWRRKRSGEIIGITASSSSRKKKQWISMRALSLVARYSPSSTTTCKEFAYEELMQSTDGFADESMVADGGFGAVFLGFLRDGRKVAIKRLYHDNSRRVEQFYNEIRMLSSLDHPNLVKLHGFCCHEERDFMLVYEYAGNGSLADHLHGPDNNKGPDKNKNKKCPAMPWRLRLRIGRETADALCYLHHSVSPPIYHRDVKSANILIDEDFRVKLGDFGLSRFVPLDASHVSTLPQGTPGYVDPDYHKCYQVTEKSDVYSFGVVLMELVSGRTAVDVRRGKGLVNLSSWAVTKITTEAWDELVDPRLDPPVDPPTDKTIRAVGELAFTCLQPEKDDRPSMRHVADVLARLCKQLDDHYGDGDHGSRIRGFNSSSRLQRTLTSRE